MARKKPKFNCKKCRKNLGSARASYDHFQDYPKHRTEKQLRDYKANQALIAKGGVQRRTSNGLPTVRETTRTRSGLLKFCTHCGDKRMPSHNYCGGCGDKL